MIHIGLHEHDVIAVYGANRMGRSTVLVPCEHSDVRRFTVTATDWLDTGATLSSLTVDGAAQTITDGTATFSLTASSREVFELIATASNGRKFTFDIRMRNYASGKDYE